MPLYRIKITIPPKKNISWLFFSVRLWWANVRLWWSPCITRRKNLGGGWEYGVILSWTPSAAALRCSAAQRSAARRSILTVELLNWQPMKTNDAFQHIQDDMTLIWHHFHRYNNFMCFSTREKSSKPLILPTWRRKLVRKSRPAENRWIFTPLFGAAEFVGASWF